LVSFAQMLDHAQVDFDILWQIITKDLPALVGELEKLVPPRTS